MILHVVTLFTITLACGVLGEDLKKCCKTDEYFEFVNGSYKCVRDQTRRLQILVNETDVVSKQVESECVEINDGFFVFNISKFNISKVTAPRGKVYPKCCPLNFIYNSVLHSCQENKVANHSFIQENFIKVGLPNCRVILDYKLNTTVDLDDQNGHLEISKYMKRSSSQYFGSYCIDENEESSLIVRECQESIQICEEVKCIKKCCPDGQSFINGSFCQETYKHGLNLSTWVNAVDNPTEPFAIIHNRTCPAIYVMSQEEYNFNINSKGLFTYWHEGKKIEEDITDLESYCIEHAMTEDLNDYLVFMCLVEKPEREEKFLYTFWAMIASCIFLFLTILMYIILGETKKMFGKILINYCIAMLVANGVLAYSSTGNVPSAEECQARAFSILYFCTSYFAWSNILCWDIWCTFGSTKRYGGSKQWSIDFKKFLIYSLYGWGIPFVLTMVVFVFHIYDYILPYTIQPILAIERCFFEIIPGNHGKNLFLDIPLLICQVINTILFVKTVVYCVRVKNEIDRINDTTKGNRQKKFQKDKERSLLILKLLIIMGVSFLFEVLSGFFELDKMGAVLKYIQLVWDVINALQGVFIFIIFICKKKIFVSCLKKLSTPQMSISSLHTQSTTTINGIAMNHVNP